MITSPDNPKLKLIRKLADRRHRSRTGLFVAEGEDLVAAARAAGHEPELVLRGGVDVDRRLLDSASALGSGTRVIAVYPQLWAEPAAGSCVYLHAVADPRNVGAIIRTTEALVEAVVVLGPRCADPYSGHAVRASMGSIFTQPVARGAIDETPAPRVALVAHGAETDGRRHGADHHRGVEQGVRAADDRPQVRGIGDSVQVDAKSAGAGIPHLSIHADDAGPGAERADRVEERRLDVLAGAQDELRRRARGRRRVDQILALGDEQPLALAVLALRELADELQLLVVLTGDHLSGKKKGALSDAR